jgi:small subunit ribosomal protein S4e
VAKKGQRRHLKRFALPVPLRMPRKSAVWAVKPRPGPHPAGKSMPLLLAVRDTLGLARTAGEAKRVLAGGQVSVDARTRRDPKFPIGLMDVVQILTLGKYYRVLYDRKGRLALHEIPKEEASFKLCRIVRKSVVKGGQVQLAFHDGKTSAGNFKEFSLHDTAKVTLPDFKVSERIEFMEGAKALVTGGTNVGRVGEIDGVRHMSGRQPDLIDLKEASEHFQAPKNHVFVIGKGDPLISVPGG